MKDIHPIDGHLPADLRALDDELASIRYEERPSFGPELRAELARAWAEPTPRRSPVRRVVAAAAVAAVLVGTASVPAARASLVRFVVSLAPEASVESGAPAPVVAPPAEAATPESDPPEVVDEDVREPGPPAPGPEVGLPSAGSEPVIVAPEMVDRVASEQFLRDAYPVHLQRRGVGGTVWLQLWVDEFGGAGAVEVSRSSGVRALDRAALGVAPRLRFVPATQDGRRMGTWIEFPVLFEPDPDRIERVLEPVVDPLSLPIVDADESWQLRDPLDLDALPGVVAIAAEEAQARREAALGLVATLSHAHLLERYGPAEAVLSGEAPEGVPPTEWRAAVGDAFDAALEAGEATPASLLALGRIRLRQGLRAEARSLFERGLQGALREPESATPWLVAELHYERGSLVRERWLGAAGAGQVRSDAFPTDRCVAARSSGDADYGFASVERLVAWNYLCPSEMHDVFADGFEVVGPRTAADLTLMMASYRAATEAYPGHVGANTDLLLTLAQAERWDEVLAGARRFARASGGHPTALLLAGLALHRLERTAEAAERFEAALARLDATEADALLDVAVLLGVSEREHYARLSRAERRAWQASYWAARDRVPATAVNERRVEHLARTAYAHLRFGDLFGDAAEVWVRFGRPNRVHVVDAGSGPLTEFWDYGSGPDITFVRWVSAKRTDLTPEGRAYVDDLGKVFPPQ